jgi:hypothetical protein
MIETSVDPMDIAPDSYLPAVDGDRRVIEGIEYIYCDGYWIRYTPMQAFCQKLSLIQQKA